MALSGYTDEKNSLWREMCSTLRLQLNNPYLCVMFAFLTSEAGAYDGVLVSALLSPDAPLNYNSFALSNSVNMDFSHRTKTISSFPEGLSYRNVQL